MIDNYRNFDLEELATDPFFREWVLNPTSAHNTFWTRFLVKYPEKRDLINETKTLVLAVHGYFGKKQTSPHQLQSQFEQVLERASKPEPGSVTPRKIGRRVIMRWAAAASILCVLFFGWILFNQVNEMKTVASQYGEWKTLTLPDGSVVELNANSKVKYAKSWKEGEDRQVWLQGEAFFKVEKKQATGAKFQVLTKDLTIEVLGTSFNVNSRGAQTEVFLEEGSIKLNMGEVEEILKPRDFISYSAEREVVLERRDDASGELHASWKEGVLILTDKPVAEILTKIEEIYGVTFRVGDENILEHEKTISIPMDKLEIVIPLLEGMFEAKITRDENMLIIR